MKKYILILLATVAFSSCSDSWLEFDNKNALDVSSFLTTENDLNLAVNAAYTPLAHPGMFGERYFFIINILDPYIWFENPRAGFDIFAFEPNDFKNTWRDLYLGVYRTSDILANAYRVEDTVTPEKMKVYKAQLRALRGMYYFYLVSWFNKPIFYDETNLPTNPLGSFTNSEPELFWNKLEEDLRYAGENLPAIWAGSETGRITKGAANAQLGKALLYKHYHYYLRFGKGGTPEAKANLEAAKAELKLVITSNDYELIKPVVKTKAHYQAALLSNFSYLDIPVGGTSYNSENNKESVWEVQYNDQPNNNYYLPAWLCGGSRNYEFFGVNKSGYRNGEIDPSLWFEFESVSGHPAGYSIDPRANATCFLEGDTMDWRPESGYDIGYVGSVNGKEVVKTYKLYAGAAAPPTLSSIGLKKYSYPQFTTNSAPFSAPYNVRIIRYADVLLMYAEACYQVDNDADGTGLAALNQVRSRVDMPAVAALTPAAIKHERTVELATEGHQYNDLIRWSYDPNFGIDFGTIYRGYFKTPKNLYFPIPQLDIDANKGNLKQNPGW